MTFGPQISSKGRRIGYARVSTKDQKLRMQRDALSAVNCDLIFEDHGVSGAKASRQGLDQLLEEICAGDTVIVFKLDRLGRSVLHLADLLVWFEKREIHFCSLSEGINTTTPGGKLVYHLFSAFAEFQRDVILENTLAGLEAARKRGTRLGRPRSIDTDRLLIAQKMIAQEGLTITETARRLRLSRPTLSRALSNRKFNIEDDRRRKGP
ncbi:MAG: recombinase family protein [Pseudomonadota bacterium]